MGVFSVCKKHCRVCPPLRISSSQLFAVVCSCLRCFLVFQNRASPAAGLLSIFLFARFSFFLLSLTLCLSLSLSQKHTLQSVPLPANFALLFAPACDVF